MPQVTLNVNNNPYSLACNEGEEERLQALAATIARRVDDVASALGQVGDAKLILMAALLLLDEAQANKEQSKHAADADAANIAAITAVAAKIEDIAERVKTA